MEQHHTTIRNFQKDAVRYKVAVPDRVNGNGNEHYCEDYEQGGWELYIAGMIWRRYDKPLKQGVACEQKDDPKHPVIYGRDNEQHWNRPIRFHVFAPFF
jgi:hypothetical protein